MTLNQLECFMVLAQRLNFTQAADDLFMAQVVCRLGKIETLCQHHETLQLI